MIQTLPAQGRSNMRAILVAHNSRHELWEPMNVSKHHTLGPKTNQTDWGQPFNIFRSQISFLFCSKKYIYFFWSISLREMCDKFSYHFDVAGKISANQTLQLRYLNRQKVWNFDLTQGAIYFGLIKRCICSTTTEKWRILLHLQEFTDSNFKVQIDHR